MLKVDKNYTEVYTSAYESASRLEYFCRHHSVDLNKTLEEIAKTK